jgi:hypothetical protein
MIILKFFYYLPSCFIDSDASPSYTRAHSALPWTCKTLRQEALCELQRSLGIAIYDTSLDKVYKSLPSGFLDNLRCTTFILASRKADLERLNGLTALQTVMRQLGSNWECGLWTKTLPSLFRSGSTMNATLPTLTISCFPRQKTTCLTRNSSIRSQGHVKRA